jgi:hypothetical protein
MGPRVLRTPTGSLDNVLRVHPPPFNALRTVYVAVPALVRSMPKTNGIDS